MKIRDNEQRAKNAILLIWIVLALEIVNFISSYFQYDLLQTMVNGGSVSERTAMTNDGREQTLGIISFIIFFISGITFIMWFRRAYYNLNQKASLAYSDGWAAGSWFVPIINLYRPYQIMKELYVETKKLLENKGISGEVNYTTNYLAWWWALWIINGILGQIVFRASLYANTIDELSFSTVMSMISNIIGILAAIITIKVIKDYSETEPALFEIEEENDEDEW